MGGGAGTRGVSALRGQGPRLQQRDREYHLELETKVFEDYAKFLQPHPYNIVSYLCLKYESFQPRL